MISKLRNLKDLCNNHSDSSEKCFFDSYQYKYLCDMVKWNYLIIFVIMPLLVLLHMYKFKFTLMGLC